MLRKREELELDAFFTEKFFYYQAKNVSNEVTIPLPDNPESLRTFLNSSEGAIYKTAVATAMLKIKNWANHHNIITDHCDTFIEQYLNNDFSVSTSNFTLYKEGMLYLIHIANLIDSKIILDEIKRYIIKNLIAPVIKNGILEDSGITVCGSGILTNIHDAYLKLSSYLTLPIRFLALRKELTEQIIHKILKQFEKEGIKFGIGNEIHYVNAVFNRYTNSLSIPMIVDESVDYCDIRKLDKLFDRFEKEISTLTTELIINRLLISSDVDPNALLETIRNDYINYNEYVARYINYLDIFGLETKVIRNKEEENQYLIAGNLFTINEDGLISLKWSHKYNLFLSFFNRLCNMNYINIGEAIKQSILILLDDYNIFYYPGRSLQYAYVVKESGNNHIPQNYIPLIPFFVENIAGNLTAANRWLSNFNLHQQQELIKGVSEFLCSEEFKNLTKEEIEVKEISYNKLIQEFYLLNSKNIIKTSKSLEIILTENVKIQIDILKTIDGEHINKIGITSVNDYLKFLSIIQDKAKFIFVNLIKDNFTQQLLAVHNDYDLKNYMECFNKNEKLAALKLLTYDVIVSHIMANFKSGILDLMLKQLTETHKIIFVTEFLQCLKENNHFSIGFGGISDLKKLLSSLNADELISCFGNENIFNFFKSYNTRDPLTGFFISRSEWEDIFWSFLQAHNDIDIKHFYLKILQCPTINKFIISCDQLLSFIQLIQDFSLSNQDVANLLDLINNSNFLIENETVLLRALLSILLSAFKNNQFQTNEQRFQFIINIPWNKINDALFFEYITKFYCLLPGGEIFNHINFDKIDRYQLILSLKDPTIRIDIILKHLTKSFNDTSIDVQNNIKLLKMTLASFNVKDNIFIRPGSVRLFNNNNQHYLAAKNTLEKYENIYGENKKPEIRPC